ncbi:MAG: glycosyltransferase family 4 protein [Chloroflexi bacterium]|nr:glycosyltransferase family 4 protein [Chloroflexota bacterium]
MVAPTSFFSSYGCHVRIAEEADALRRMGHQVKVVTYHNGGSWNGLPIERTLSVPWRKDTEVGSSRHKLAFDALLGLKMLAVALRERPDVIHAHLHEGALLGFPAHLLTGAPLIFDFQGSLTSEMVDHHFLNPAGALYRPARRLEEAINNLPNALIVSSQRAARLLRREYGCRNPNITVVPDCVNGQFFHPDVLSADERQSLKARLGIPTHHKVVVSLGLLAEYQGTGLLLNAARDIVAARSDVHFLIMGYPSAEIYQARAAQLGISAFTTFTGKIHYSEAPRYLALGDVAVAAKLSATEGIGKVLNYMAMGLPTVAFDTDVSREYLAELGVYARAGDSADLARALLAALDDDPSTSSGRDPQSGRGRALRQRALQDYTWEQAGRQILHVYESCLAQRSSAVSLS